MLDKNVYDPYGTHALADLTKNESFLQDLLLQRKIKDNLNPTLILLKLCLTASLEKYITLRYLESFPD